MFGICDIVDKGGIYGRNKVRAEPGGWNVDTVAFCSVSGNWKSPHFIVSSDPPKVSVPFLSVRLLGFDFQCYDFDQRVRN